ncbi:hypothetical protein [Streptomyces sp. TRM70350]|uniref:hypothetical protein n=1 Tax=Streptomyces sp. TRM70350 TaxID=2856165 RepID=UPI001C43BAA9|nr:hypothetical protein [Streptomyces sp. TRM70350]MBV7701042.1 hypothetical protein [Streptomyces sp. TRM70350]
MTNVDEPQARARQANTYWEVWCPEDGGVLYDLGAFETPQDSDEAAAAHNDQFTPPHNARGTLRVPPLDELLEQLTGDQLETLQKAALLVIGARGSSHPADASGSGGFQRRLLPEPVPQVRLSAVPGP